MDTPAPGAGGSAAGTVLAARRRGRPAVIDREQVVQAARNVGLQDLSMKAVADRLGVSVPALYHHVKGRDELVSLVADALAEQVLVDERPGQTWRDWVHEAALNLHYMFEQAPGLARHARAFGHLTPAILQLHEQACQRLVLAGFTPVQAYLVTRSVADLVESDVDRADTLRAQGADPKRVLPGAGRDTHPGADAFPTLTRALETLGNSAPDDQFHFALHALLAGMPEPRGSGGV